MYPYRTRSRWLLSSRYGHLVRALDKRPRSLQDTTLEARVAAMRFWNRIHAVVIVLLSIGLAGALAAWVARVLPAFDPAAEAVDQLTVITGTASGVLTLAYLFVTRLLGQLEADILAILTVDHHTE